MGCTTEDYESWEAWEGEADEYTKKESRESFLNGLQAAVAAGGVVEVEEFTSSSGHNVKNYCFKSKRGNYSISEKDAIKYCRY